MEIHTAFHSLLVIAKRRVSFSWQVQQPKLITRPLSQHWYYHVCGFWYWQRTKKSLSPVMESRTPASRPRPRTQPSRPRPRTRLSRPRPRTLQLSSRILENEDLSSRTPTLKHRIKCFGETPNTLHIYSVIGNGPNSKLLPLKSSAQNMRWLVKSVSSSFSTDLSHEAKAKDSTLKAKTKDFKIVLEDLWERGLVVKDSNTDCHWNRHT